MPQPSLYSIPNIKKDIAEIKDEIESLKKNLMYLVNALVKNNILSKDLNINKTNIKTTYPARTDAVNRNEERVERVH